MKNPTVEIWGEQFIDGSQLTFKNANEAFKQIYAAVNAYGYECGNGTKAFYNLAFNISNPLDRDIKEPWRNWSKKYAEREWKWYLEGDPSVTELKKYAPIWDNMHTGDDIVNSNYGFLWSENNQIAKTIDQLRSDPNTRQAWISLFDGKRKDQYVKDTPCTLNVGFSIFEGMLDMTVIMRSNDIWYGFCNDQYCFSKLQEVLATELEVEVGQYHHFAANMHVYAQHYDLCV